MRTMQFWWVADFLPESTRDPETNVVTPENGCSWKLKYDCFLLENSSCFQGRTVFVQGSWAVLNGDEHMSNWISIFPQKNDE